MVDRQKQQHKKEVMESIEEYYLNRYLQWESPETRGKTRAFREYTRKPDQNASKEEWENWEKKLAWFGESGGYTVDGETVIVYSGIHDPETIRRIEIWESQGLDKLVQEIHGKSLFLLSGEEVSETQKKEFIDSLTEQESIVWNGKHLYELDMDDLERAAAGVEEKYREQINPEGISIKGLMNPGEEEKK